VVILKQVFDESRPSTLLQWWNDRRNGVQWYTFWVAILVLLFTMFFGMVQSIEGALQVYKAYHPTPTWKPWPPDINVHLQTSLHTCRHQDNCENPTNALARTSASTWGATFARARHIWGDPRRPRIRCSNLAHANTSSKRRRR